MVIVYTVCYQMQPDGLSSVYGVSGHSHVTPFGQRKRPEPQGTRWGALVELSTLTKKLYWPQLSMGYKRGLCDRLPLWCSAENS